MRIKPIQVNTSNRLITDYHLQKEEIMSYFSYKPFASLEERVIDLQNRHFERESLSEILHKMNEKWDAPEKTLQQIERLKDNRSVVVIGGQQAGLLTGPLYTVNKIISIITYAKKQEEKLNIPVIPVFWIAGEDHDYDEINHIYSVREHKLYKHATTQPLYLKQSIAHVQIDREKTIHWLEEAFQDLVETEHTKHIYDLLIDALNQSNTYVDFFARIIFQLFPNDGIVLMNSADKDVRHLESKWFVQMIEQQSDIANAVYDTVQTLQQSGYNIALEIECDDVHLFYHDENNERILLKKDGDYFIGKNDEIVLAKDELIRVAIENPERLSNNVVTRPMMQELLFPTLAFFGGDGEIGYWVALKEAFSKLDESLQLPPVLPRLSFTYVTNRINKLLRSRNLPIEHVINHGIEEEKINWLMSQNQPPLDLLFNEVKREIDKIHLPLRKYAREISADLGEEAEKNLQYIQKNISYLENKMKHKLIEKYNQQLLQFEEINYMLKPNNLLQERIWNPLFFINQFGIDLFQRLTNEIDVSVENKHYVIYLD